MEIHIQVFTLLVLEFISDGIRYSTGACLPQPHHIDITGDSGVFFEKQYKSDVRIEGLKFPNGDRGKEDQFEVEFKTKELNGLIFHAQSQDETQEMTAWVSGGYLTFRLRGQCKWIVISNKLSLHKKDDTFVSDGKFHKIQVTYNKNIYVKIDNGRHRMFRYTALSSFHRSCWQVNSFNFGSPSRMVNEDKHRYVRRRYPEYYEKMDLCVKKFSIKGETSAKNNVKYQRVSSCPTL